MSQRWFIDVSWQWKPQWKLVLFNKGMDPRYQFRKHLTHAFQSSQLQSSQNFSHVLGWDTPPAICSRCGCVKVMTLLWNTYPENCRFSVGCSISSIQLLFLINNGLQVIELSYIFHSTLFFTSSLLVELSGFIFNVVYTQHVKPHFLWFMHKSMWKQLRHNFSKKLKSWYSTVLN